MENVQLALLAGHANQHALVYFLYSAYPDWDTFRINELTAFWSKPRLGKPKISWDK